MTEAQAVIHPAFVTTLAELPGYPTLRALGMVAGVGSGAGRVARNKGIIAYNEAMDEMCKMAAECGANAILGVNVTTFGSSIGGAFGDAVGVTLVGTAVVIGTA